MADTYCHKSEGGPNHFAFPCCYESNEFHETRRRHSGCTIAFIKPGAPLGCKGSIPEAAGGVKSVCRTYVAPVQGSPDVLELSGKATPEGVHAGLVDFPYKTYLIAEYGISENGRLRLKKISVLVGVLLFVVDLGVHGHRFCPALESKPSTSC